MSCQKLIAFGIQSDILKISCIFSCISKSSHNDCSATYIKNVGISKVKPTLFKHTFYIRCKCFQLRYDNLFNILRNYHILTKYEILHHTFRNSTTCSLCNSRVDFLKQGNYGVGYGDAFIRLHLSLVNKDDILGPRTDIRYNISPCMLPIQSATAAKHCGKQYTFSIVMT